MEILQRFDLTLPWFGHVFSYNCGMLQAFWLAEGIYRGSPECENGSSNTTKFKMHSYTGISVKFQLEWNFPSGNSDSFAGSRFHSVFCETMEECCCRAPLVSISCLIALSMAECGALMHRCGIPLWLITAGPRSPSPLTLLGHLQPL